jgi:hypothetical protein
MPQATTKMKEMMCMTVKRLHLRLAKVKAKVKVISKVAVAVVEAEQTSEGTMQLFHSAHPKMVVSQYLPTHTHTQCRVQSAERMCVLTHNETER